MQFFYAAFHVLLISACILLTSCGNSGESIGPAADWQPATLLMNNASGAGIKSDDNGNFYSVWLQTNDNVEIYVNTCTPNGRWGVPLKIGQVLYFISGLQLAVSPNGHAVVVWADTFHGEGLLHVVRYSPDKGWGKDKFFEKVGLPSDVTIDNSGTIVIAAARFFQSGFDMIQFDVVSGWSSEWIPYLQTGGYGAPRIAMNEKGNGFVLYAETDPDDFKLYVRRRQATGWGAPELIDICANYPSEMQWDIAVDSSGNAMVVWGNRNTDAQSVAHTFARAYSTESGWGGIRRLDTSSFTCIDQFLTCDKNGNFYAAWIQLNENSNYDVHTCRYHPDSGWQRPQKIGSGGTARLPRLVANEKGNVVAVWQQYFSINTDPEAAQLYVNQYTSSTGWGTQKPLMNVFGSAESIDVAINQTGEAVAIWTQTLGNYRFPPLTHAIFAAWLK